MFLQGLRQVNTLRGACGSECDGVKMLYHSDLEFYRKGFIYFKMLHGCIGVPCPSVSFIFFHFSARGKVTAVKRVFFETP